MGSLNHILFVTFLNYFALQIPEQDVGKNTPKTKLDMNEKEEGRNKNEERRLKKKAEGRRKKEGKRKK